MAVGIYMARHRRLTATICVAVIIRVKSLLSSSGTMTGRTKMRVTVMGRVTARVISC